MVFRFAAHHAPVEMRVNFFLISTGIGGAKQSQWSGEICQHWLQVVWTQLYGVQSFYLG
jgi:hypothetical protein